MFERFIVAGGRSLFEGMAEVLTDCQSSEEMSGVMDSTRAFYQLVVVSVAVVKWKPPFTNLESLLKATKGRIFVRLNRSVFLRWR